MAALRQLLNPGGNTKKAPSEEDQRRTDAKMQAMAYSISPPVPTRLRSSEDQRQRPSQFNENSFATHPLFRGGDPNGLEHGNSFDDPSRPQLSRSATDDHLHQSYAMHNGRSGIDVPSYYEDGEQSPTLSPALHKHLALRPLDPHGQQQQQQHTSHSNHGRHRSRSATDENLYYAGERENNTPSKEHKKHKPKQESVAGGSTKLLPEKRSDEKMKERTIEKLLRDRQQTPTQTSSVRVAIVYNFTTYKLTCSICRAGLRPKPLSSPTTKPPRSHIHSPGLTAPRPTLLATASATV